MCGAVVLVEGSGAEICRFDCLSDNVRFADPGALRVWQDDGDRVSCFLKVLDEGVDIRRRLVGRRTVVVYYLTWCQLWQLHDAVC